MAAQLHPRPLQTRCQRDRSEVSAAPDGAERQGPRPTAQRAVRSCPGRVRDISRNRGCGAAWWPGVVREGAGRPSATEPISPFEEEVKEGIEGGTEIQNQVSCEATSSPVGELVLQGKPKGVPEAVAGLLGRHPPVFP